MARLISVLITVAAFFAIPAPSFAQNSTEYIFKLLSEPEVPVAGSRTLMTFTLTDPQGKPIQTKVVKTSSEVFNDAAIEAIMKYTFKPAMQSNSPVTAKIYIPIDFRLK